MLRFANNPDKIFTVILELAFGFGIDQINVCSNKYIRKCFLPHASQLFSPETAKKILSELINYNNTTGLWELNDFHYCLIYDVLSNFCDVQNDLAKEANEPILTVDGNKIYELDFDAILDYYFFDTDFLVDKSVFLNMTEDSKKIMGFSQETFGVIMGMKAHPDELIIKLHKKGKFKPKNSEPEFYKKRSRKYPC